MSITQTPLSFSSEMKIGRCSSSTGVSEEKIIHPSSRFSSHPSLNLIWFHHKKRQADSIGLKSAWSLDGPKTKAGQTGPALHSLLLHFVTAVNVNPSPSQNRRPKGWENYLLAFGSNKEQGVTVCARNTKSRGWAQMQTPQAQQVQFSDLLIKGKLTGHKGKRRVKTKNQSS